MSQVRVIDASKKICFLWNFPDENEKKLNAIVFNFRIVRWYAAIEYFFTRKCQPNEFGEINLLGLFKIWIPDEAFTKLNIAIWLTQFWWFAFSFSNSKMVTLFMERYKVHSQVAIWFVCYVHIHQNFTYSVMLKLG